MSLHQKLRAMRKIFSEANVFPYTHGLSNNEIAVFQEDPNLNMAVTRAADVQSKLLAKYPKLFVQNEKTLSPILQKDFLQFYDPVSVSPYIPIAAQGPWIITHTGAVVYDAGGYGMLGFGHSPEDVLTSMAEPTVQANIMTPSFSQLKFSDMMAKEIGHTRGGNPYHTFACLNSGSEAMTLALRITDAHAKKATKAGTPNAGRPSVIIHLAGSFHGRTDRPASVSGSSFPSYKSHLKSFEGGNPITTYNVDINDSHALKELYRQLDSEKIHVECVVLEPCMGEGNPGVLVTREFYDLARELTKKHDSLLIVDSVQAGLRAQGTLSLVDYPGFSNAECPDIEAFSKAINAGQYPFSVIALSNRAHIAYVTGLHGNTMTTNPRALNTATTVLSKLTPKLRKNIIERGKHFRTELENLKIEFPEMISHATGSGLLVAAHIKEPYLSHGKPTSIENISRRNGINVIHGGKNALRFTPVFDMTEKEVDLVIENLKRSFAEHAVATGHQAPPITPVTPDFFKL